MAKMQMSEGKWIATVGGIFVLVSALVSVFGPPLVRRLEEAREIQITDLAFIKTEQNIGVDLVLWNRSVVPLAIKSATVRWSQNEPESGFPYAATVIPTSTYHVRPELRLLSEKKGRIRGTTVTLEEAKIANGTVHNVDGEWQLYGVGSWSLIVRLPVREQLDPGQHLTLVVLLPNSISVGEKRAFPAPAPLSDANLTRINKYLAEYITGDKASQLHFRALLERAGDVKLQCSINFGEDERTSFAISADP